MQPRLSAESGFWKTIWIERLSSSVGRLVDRAARRMRGLRGCCRYRGSRCRGWSWPAWTCRAGLADEAERVRHGTAGGSATRAGTSWPLWWKVFETCSMERARSSNTFFWGALLLARLVLLARAALHTEHADLRDPRVEADSPISSRAGVKHDFRCIMLLAPSA